MITDDDDNIINDNVKLELKAFIWHSSDLATVDWLTVDTTSGRTAEPGRGGVLCSKVKRDVRRKWVTFFATDPKTGRFGLKIS